MAVTNLYSNLPGHLVEFKDGGLQLTSSTTDTSSTKSLLILGTAVDGPVNEPVKIDATTVSQVFGKEVNADGFPNGATLTKYAKQAFKNGFDDVRCMRVTGSQAYTTIVGQQTTDYLDASGLIDGAEATDGTGVIKGNPLYTYDFTESDNCFVPVDGTDAHFFVNNVEVGLETGAIQWDSFKGFHVAADSYTGVTSFTLQCKGFVFLGNSGTGLGKYNTQTEAVSVDGTSGEFNPIEITLVTNSNSEAAAIYDSKDGNGNYVDNHTQYNSDLPSISSTDLNEDGFNIIKSGETVPLVKGTDYTAELTNDGKYIVTPIDGGALADGDSIVITYYPYEEVDIEKTLTDPFNGTITDSTIDISAMDGLTDAEIISVTVGSTVLESTRYQVTGSTLEIIDQTNLTPNAVIKVAYSYKDPVTYNLELKVKSQWGGSIYKDAKVEVKKVQDGSNVYTEIEFTKPSKKTGKKFSYSSKYYQTVDDLILGMKNDINNLNMFDIEIVKGEGTDHIDLLQATPAKALDQGGEDGLKPSNNEMFKALSGERYTNADIGTPISPYSTEIVTADMVGFLKTQGAYQILENYNVDYIYPAGIYADSVQTVNPNSDFQRELALVCAVLTYRTKMTHGFIDVKPNSNTTLVGIDAYVAKLVNGHQNIYYMVDENGDVIYDSENKPMDIGWYTSVVVGPEVVMTSDTLGTYYGSPAIAYAALNAVLEPQSSPLNKALRNVNGIKFKFSNKQMDAIIGNRMVCFKLKNEGLATASSVPYVVDGITAGAPGCDYSDIAIVKVVTDVVDNIREVADPFIGEHNTVEQRNALSALISKRLAKLVELGEIQSYEFEVSATIQQQLLGEASIALTIVPAMTLKRITTVVALRAAE